MPASVTGEPARPATAHGRLTRAALARHTGAAGPAPVRIVHLGLGSFHRAHQAWYTATAADAEEWGIAAFTGRSPEAARELAAQDGLFTLLERSGDGDRATVVTSIVEARDGAELDRLVTLLAAPSTAVVTLTITEAGYRLTADAEPDPTDPTLQRDLTWLRQAVTAERFPEHLGEGPVTPLGRLLLGLEARRRFGAGPLAVVPCDNMPDNGRFVRTGLVALAELVSPRTAAWVADQISVVSTSVDRITPRTTPADLLAAGRLTGWRDLATVVAEPFTDWVLAGEFPAGRPAWETAGARFVTDISPFERRKMWLLNGSHTLMAYAGRLTGHTTVAAATADPVVRGWVEEFWDEALQALPATGLDLPGYRAALLERFENRRIAHQLAQIALEGSTKLRVRVVPTLLAERAAGRSGTAASRAVAAWIALVLGEGAPPDAQAEAIARAAAHPHDDAVPLLAGLVHPQIAADPEVLDQIRSQVAGFR